VGCLLAVCLLLLSSCAGLGRALFESPLDERALTVVVADLKEENEKVQSFFSSGRLWVKGWYGDDGEANIFAATTRAPCRMKIEATHPWGQPILYLLEQGKDFRLLSYSERRLYFGELSARSLSRFLPGNMDQTVLRDILRAYPVLEPSYRVLSKKGNQISFCNPQGEEVRIVELDRETLLPREMVLPHQNIKLVFENFQESGGFRYARKVTATHFLGGKLMVYTVEKMVFNQKIPNQVFTLQAPPGFEITPVEQESETSQSSMKRFSAHREPLRAANRL
jgi:hypothetical protein